MKKKLVILITSIMCMFSLLNGQKAGQQELSLKGGLSLAKFRGNDADIEDGPNAEFSAGISLGASLSMPISKQLSIRPEILLTRKGNKYSQDGITATYKLNYIEFPILAEINLSREVKLFAGPYLSLLANAEIEFEYNGETDSEELSIFSDTDLGFSLGGLVRFNRNVGAEARYSFGGTDLLDTSSSVDLKNGSFQAYIVLFL